LAGMTDLSFLELQAHVPAEARDTLDVVEFDHEYHELCQLQGLQAVPPLLFELQYGYELHKYQNEHASKSSPPILRDLDAVLEFGSDAFFARRRLGHALYELVAYLTEHRLEQIDADAVMKLRTSAEDAATRYATRLHLLTHAMRQNPVLHDSPALRRVLAHLSAFDQALEREQRRARAQIEELIENHNCNIRKAAARN
jgi:hypothetical protein